MKLEKIKEIAEEITTEFKNGKLYIEGLFNVDGQLFKELKKLGHFEDCNNTVYIEIGTFNTSYYKYIDKEYGDSTVRSYRIYYGYFIFEIDDVKPIKLNEFLDKTGYIVDKYVNEEKTMAEWFIKFATN